jgi:hypothetical protein
VTRYCPDRRSEGAAAAASEPPGTGTDSTAGMATHSCCTVPSARSRARSTSDFSKGWPGKVFGLHPARPQWQAPGPALVYAVEANPRTCPGPQTKLSPRATTRREALWRGFVLTAIWRFGARWPISLGGCRAEPLAPFIRGRLRLTRAGLTAAERQGARRRETIGCWEQPLPGAAESSAVSTSAAQGRVTGPG